jgi:hypothetical protein
MIVFYGILIYFSLYFVSGSNLFVDIEYGDNQTFIIYYNLTTNYSYYVTYRLFEHKQIKSGLFSSKIRENKFLISNQYDTPTTLVYLFIICFHFIRRLNDIDIQCEDIRLLKLDPQKSILPTYKPLFVPMMYALSILMLLPVIIQHRRRKHAAFIKRRSQLRHLSISISHDNPDILSKFVEHGTLNLKNMPIELELISSPTTRTTLNEVDSNDNVTYKLRKSRVYFDTYKQEENDDEQSAITADDCIAHLINSTPWNSTLTNRVSLNSDSMDVLQEQYIPMMRKFYNTERGKRQSHDTINFFRSNPAFIESDV